MPYNCVTIIFSFQILLCLFCSDKSDYLLLVNAVMQRWWLADPDCVCPMICADYLDLVNSLTDQWLVDIPDIKRTQLWQSLGSSDTNLQVHVV